MQTWRLSLSVLWREGKDSGGTGVGVGIVCACACGVCACVCVCGAGEGGTLAHKDDSVISTLCALPFAFGPTYAPLPAITNEPPMADAVRTHAHGTLAGSVRVIVRLHVPRPFRRCAAP
jgi:hypothetical protein